jgi:hypothetical protein
VNVIKINSWFVCLGIEKLIVATSPSRLLKDEVSLIRRRLVGKQTAQSLWGDSLEKKLEEVLK